MIKRAAWPLTLSKDLPAGRITELRERIDATARTAQYGWGHTIDFGPFEAPGILGDLFLDVVGTLDDQGWLPARLDGLRVADVGCFTGGIAAILAARGAARVFAVDEIPEHIRQCEIVADAFRLASIETVESSIYRLPERIPEGSLDLILLAGVLYHLSDMLVGLEVLRRLLAPGGVLLVESNAVDDPGRSYANFGRFFAGMWWQPSGLCIRDMCEFMGYESIEVVFYRESRCLARATRAPGEIPFKRGLNTDFESLRDGRSRPLDPAVMAPARDPRGSS